MTEKKRPVIPRVILIIIILVLVIIKINFKQDRKSADNAGREMGEMMRRFNASDSTSNYLSLKKMILNLSTNELGINHKNANILSVMYDLGSEGGGTLVITIDSTATHLSSGKIKNSIWKTTDKNMLKVSDTIFSNAFICKDHMKLFSGEIVDPEKNHIKVYVRTNNLETYIMDIDIIDKKNRDEFAQLMIDGFKSLWVAFKKSKINPKNNPNWLKY